jgi:hypothetical protein
MAIFQAVTLNWEGRDYVVPADRVFGAIGVVEDVVTFPELVQGLQLGRPNMSKLARAYGALLRYAGANVTDEEIFAGMFVVSELQKNITTAINTLMVLMTPPSAMLSGEPASGNAQAANLPRSSNRSSKRRLAAAG